ncbi:hypothetical protein H2203_000273 [Taxawa tesnikishii (nom. ined.)]|nr:hypothetical protein H2203_000273 [Dothideales sp. JES 119]
MEETVGKKIPVLFQEPAFTDADHGFLESLREGIVVLKKNDTEENQAVPQFDASTLVFAPAAPIESQYQHILVKTDPVIYIGNDVEAQLDGLTTDCKRARECARERKRLGDATEAAQETLDRAEDMEIYGRLISVSARLFMEHSENVDVPALLLDEKDERSDVLEMTTMYWKKG